MAVGAGKKRDMRKAIYVQAPVKYATVPEAMQRYRLGKNTLMNILKDTSALKRFGRVIRVDIGVADKILDSYED